MTATINGQTMYIKHIDASFALLVDEDEKEYKVSGGVLKSLFPFNVKRVKNRLNK